jgi:hypothetical protein
MNEEYGHISDAFDMLPEEGLLMTDEQIKMLRRLIQDEIECAQIDGFEHGKWGWAERQLDERWKVFKESFNE